MKKELILILMIGVFLVGCSEVEINYTEEHITDLICDADSSCPKELECWNLPDKRSFCMDLNPCEWYCHNECIILESYPPQLYCDTVENAGETPDLPVAE